MCNVSPPNGKQYYLLAQCGNMRRSTFAQATFVDFTRDFVIIEKKSGKYFFSYAYVYVGGTQSISREWWER